MFMCNVYGMIKTSQKMPTSHPSTPVVSDEDIAELARLKAKEDARKKYAREYHRQRRADEKAARLAAVAANG
jgi:hypothetical protein